MSKPLLQALKGDKPDRIPVWLMRQAGRYLPEYRNLRERAGNFLDFCYRPELAVTATLQPIERFGLDGAIIFSDILVIPDALGQDVRFEPGRGPILDPLKTSDDVRDLSLDRLETHLAPVYEALDGAAGKLPSDTTLIGFAGAPWTIASYMIEGGSSKNFLKLKTWAYGDPAGFQSLIDILVEAISRHLSAQITAGAEAVQIFDSWAGILPQPEFVRWSVQPIAEIIHRVKSDHPETPMIAFPNRAGQLYGQVAKDSGADAVSIDMTVPLDYARSVLQPLVTVQGNLDPVALVVGGDSMRRQTRDILEALGEGRFVFNLGHGILPETPPEHVSQLVEEIRKWPR